MYVIICVDLVMVYSTIFAQPGQALVSDVLSDIPICHEGVRILGSPLGETSEFKTNLCSDYAASCSRDIEAALDLGEHHPQEAFHLLRLCFSPNYITY